MKIKFPILLILGLILSIIVFVFTSNKKIEKHPAKPIVKSTAKPNVKTISNSIGQEFVYIKPGCFMMGSNSGDYDEMLIHNVTLTNGFYMQTTEVTQGQWYDIMGTKHWVGGEYVQENRDNPAVYISWDDAKEFIRKLNNKDGKQYRLPTEAEWEYACRAGSSSKYSFGDSKYQLREYAWIRKNTHSVGNSYAHNVGTKKANSWGLYDMHGNVSEWCEDWYGHKYYSSESMTNPMGPSTGQVRVFRGSSWFSSDDRGGCEPFVRYPDFGFRLVMNPEKNSKKVN